MSEHDSMTEKALDALLRQQGALWLEARAGCPHPDLLVARGSELVDEDTRRRLNAHVAGCDACARLSAGLADLRLAEPDAAMEQRVLSRVTSTGMPIRRRLPMAAAVALAAGAAALWWRVASPTPTIQRAPTTTSAAAEPPASGATLAPIALWRIDVAPVRLPIASLDASRGQQGGSQVPPGLIDALTPYQSGDYEAAVAELTRVVQAHPDSADASFYLGVASLLANRPSEAIAPLRVAAQQAVGERRDAVGWYLAAAEQRTGHPDAARARLAPLCRASGSFQSRACDAIQALR
jgi:TolA-binding protein